MGQWCVPSVRARFAHPSENTENKSVFALHSSPCTCACDDRVLPTVLEILRIIIVLHAYPQKMCARSLQGLSGMDECADLAQSDDSSSNIANVATMFTKICAAGPFCGSEWIASKSN